MNPPQQYPAGWDAARVQKVIDHYDNLSEDDLADEIEASMEDEDYTLISVPNELAAEVLALIAQRQAA